MRNVKVLVLRTAGTNCDLETCHAFKLAGARVELHHINQIKRSKKFLDRYHILAIPGGFTYGDDVASGKILANEINSCLKDQVYRFVHSGKLVIGICNGFQVLVKMGMLPSAASCRDHVTNATLGLNDSGKFICRWVYLKNLHFQKKITASAKSPLSVWTKGLPEIVTFPIAHAEGKFIPLNNTVLGEIESNRQVVFRYCDASGSSSGGKSNPNGSVRGIAGLCDPTGRVIGMMPHPERHTSFLQHPNWRRKDVPRDELASGFHVFKSGVDFVRNNF